MDNICIPFYLFFILCFSRGVIITVICISWFAWSKRACINRCEKCVDINGTFSDFLSLDISVIQGSTLGPILFLCVAPAARFLSTARAPRGLHRALFMNSVSHGKIWTNNAASLTGLSSLALHSANSIF